MMREKESVGGLFVTLAALFFSGCAMETDDQEDFAQKDQAIHMGINIFSAANDDPEVMESTVRITDLNRWLGTGGETYPELDKSCSAVVLSPRAIVTSAHCFDRYTEDGIEKPWGLEANESDWFMVSVKAALNYTTQPFEFRGWFYVSTHPDYDTTGSTKNRTRNDMAILVHTSPVLSDIDAAEVWTDEIYTGMRLDMYGWGPNSMSGSGSGTLRKARDNAQLRVDAFGSKYLKGSSTKARTCAGDSGGPLVRWRDMAEPVIGILSRSNRTEACTSKNGSQFYTRLAPKLSWIESKLGHSCLRRVSDGLITCAFQED